LTAAGFSSASGQSLSAPPQVETESWPEAPALFTHQGEALPPSAIGPVIVEGWDEVFAREARAPRVPYLGKHRNGAQGEWVIAPRRRHG
jgi:hypothetical protein